MCFFSGCMPAAMNDDSCLLYIMYRWVRCNVNTVSTVGAFICNEWVNGRNLMQI